MKQEELAVKTGISIPHMSHIETSSTKLSLEVLVKIANVLEVGADELLGRNIDASASVYIKEICEIAEDCTPYELNVMVNTMQLVKQSIRNIPQKEEDE